MYNEYEEKALRRYFNRTNIGNVVLSGPSGLGKKRLVLSLIRERMCLCEKKVLCTCDSCRRFTKNMHPDFLEISPEKNVIKKENVKEVHEFLYNKPVLSKERYILIDDAHLMTVEAQNSLLKIVEEVGECDKFIFISSGVILDTIRSRSTEFSFNQLPYEIFQEAFNKDIFSTNLLYVYSQGAIGTAKALDESEYSKNLVCSVKKLTKEFINYSVIQLLRELKLLSEKNKNEHEVIMGSDLKPIMYIVMEIAIDVLRQMQNLPTRFEYEDNSFQSMCNQEAVSSFLSELTNQLNEKLVFSRDDLIISLTKLMNLKEERNVI